jgi:hypothetical protein
MDNNNNKNIICDLTMLNTMLELKDFCKKHSIKGYTTKKTKKELFDYIMKKCKVQNLFSDVKEKRKPITKEELYNLMSLLGVDMKKE